MDIKSEFTDLVRDNNVRYILQQIYDALKTDKQSNPTVYAKVQSYTGKVELLNQNKPISNDEYFLQLLINKEAIKNLNFDSRDPRTKKDYIDDILLNSPNEFKTPYISVSFDIVDRMFLKELCDTAADAFILNSYPFEEQNDIVLTTINIVNGHLKNENIILTWDEFDNSADVRRIQIIKVLNDLHVTGIITLRKLNYNLLNILKGGRVEFQANLIYRPSSTLLSKSIIKYKSLALDTYHETVYYNKIGKWIGFDKRHGRKVLYEILKAFTLKEGRKTLTDIEIWKIIEPRGKRPKQIQSDQLDRIIDATHRLNVKFQKKDFIKRDKTISCYYLNP